MEKQIIHTSKAPAPIGPYSQAIRIGDFLFISSQIAIVPETGDLHTDNISEETKQVMHNVREILLAAGMDFSHVVKTSIFLNDMKHFSVVNEVYGTFFTTNPPARETVEVSQLPKGVHVEISCIAAG